MSAETPGTNEEVWDLLAQLQVPLWTRITLQEPLRIGRLKAKVARNGDALAVVLVASNESWCQVELARGDEALVMRLLTQLQTDSEGVLWDDDLPSTLIPGEVLDAAGFKQVQREEFLQDLARVPLEPPAIEGFTVSRLLEPDFGAVRELYVSTHLAMAATALYTTWPVPPSAASMRARFNEMMRGVDGTLVPDASVVVKLGDQVAGFVCCAEAKPAGEAMLLDLGVSSAAQGRGLSRLLVRWAQRALKRAGFERMRFFTTGGNLPVHKLFVPEEILETRTFRARLWMKGVHA